MIGHTSIEWSGARAYSLVHVLTVWCTCLQSGARAYSLVHVLTVWCTCLQSGACAYSLVRVLAVWCVCLQSGACAYSLVRVLTVWCTCLQSGACAYTCAKLDNLCIISRQVNGSHIRWLFNLGEKRGGVIRSIPRCYNGYSLCKGRHPICAV